MKLNFSKAMTTLKYVLIFFYR